MFIIHVDPVSEIGRGTCILESGCLLGHLSVHILTKSFLGDTYSFIKQYFANIDMPVHPEVLHHLSSFK